MIKNQRQYQHTKKQIEAFRSALENFDQTGRGPDVDPVMVEAMRSGIRSQLETMEREAEEFDALSAGRIDLIELDSLDRLPLGLIKARIARGLTQKQLAERLGVKPQQIQRWEFENYEDVGFSKLVEIANALELKVWESIYLPKADRSAVASLRSLGIDKDFLVARIAPTNEHGPASPDAAPPVLASSARLSRIFGIELLANGRVVDTGRLALAGGGARFKLPANADATRARAYSLYVSYLADRVALSVTHIPISVVPRNWQELRHCLFRNEPADFATAVKAVWALGIPVIPLCDPIRFHGCCWRSEGRNVVVLKQSVRYSSRWLFDLVHELYHAGEEPASLEFRRMDEDPTASERRESDEESAANELAGNVLLNGRAEWLYTNVLQQAAHVTARIKSATQAVATAESVDVGILANYVAMRLKSDHFVDWWGTAANLQPESEDPFEVARRIFFEYADLSGLSQDDRSLVEQAVSEPRI